MVNQELSVVSTDALGLTQTLVRHIVHLLPQVIQCLRILG